MTKIKAIDFADYVEDCRKELIRLHKDKGILVNNNTSLRDTIELTRYYNNIAPGCFTPQDDIPELPDLFKLVDEEPLIGDETPAVIIVATDLVLSQTFYLDKGHVIKTSDGKVYYNTDSTFKTITHNWDVSKDIEVASHNFKLRWVMYIGGHKFHYAGNYSYEVISILEKNSNITSLAREYSAYTRYHYFDKCNIAINNTATNGNMPSMIMARNCNIDYCNVAKETYIRNEQLLNINNLKPFSNYKHSEEYKLSITNVTPNHCINSATYFYTKDTYSIRGTHALFVSTDVSSAASITASGVDSYSDTTYIPAIEYIFTSIDENNLGNTLTFSSLNGAVNIVNPINYNIKFPTSASSKICRTTMINILHKLKDLTGESAKTCTFGAPNLANLTAEEIAIGTNKNWTIS